MFNLDDYLRQRRNEVEALLDRKLPPAETRPAALHSAMRYAVLAGGKRLRPILCIAAAEAVAHSRAVTPLAAGAAIELLHTYTLIHDDLPAMDDDALRRGRPTTHIQYGEATAILAGDALLTLAFEWLAEVPVPTPYPSNRLIIELARAAGSQGVIAGQVEDIAAEGAEPTPEMVDYIHRHKTGDLITAAVRIGAILAGAPDSLLAALTRYAESIGLAFQIADDILNATSTAEKLGKAVGSDAQRGKATWVALHGLDAAKTRARDLVENALAQLAHCPANAEPLRALAQHIVNRKN